MTAFAHDSLDRDKLLTILADNGAKGLVGSSDAREKLNFSFLNANADRERAQRDLVLVVDTLATRPELDAAFEAATNRLCEDGDEAAFDDQKRLRAEIEDSDQRLGRLIRGEETI
jgi:DNA primase